MDTTRPTGDPTRTNLAGANVAIASTASPRRISWGAIFAGSVLAGVISLCLSLLGLGISAATVNPAEPAAGIGIGAAIWIMVSNLIALFVGGWAAARLSGATRRADGVLHGLITWGFVTLLMLYVFSNALGAIVGGIAGLAGDVAQSGAVQAPSELPEGLPPADAEQAANAVGGASVLSAVAMLLGGLVAGIGGAVAARRNQRREDEMVGPGRTLVADN